MALHPCRRPAALTACLLPSPGAGCTQDASWLAFRRLACTASNVTFGELVRAGSAVNASCPAGFGDALRRVPSACRASLAQLGEQSGAAALTTLMDNCNVSHASPPVAAAAATTAPALAPGSPTFCRLAKTGGADVVRQAGSWQA